MPPGQPPLPSGQGEAPAAEQRPVVRGLVLRSFLVLLLSSTGRPMTVPELGRGLERLGVRTATRTSKDVSDALRWEVERGRVHRVDRGTYRLGHLARSTAWRMRQRTAAVLHAERSTPPW